MKILESSYSGCERKISKWDRVLLISFLLIIKISFMMTLEEMIEKSDHEKSYYYVLMIDLDNFKTHNHQDDN